MIWTVIAMVAAGLGAAGIALILRKITGNLLPKWIIPVFAGAGMLGYQISWEYAWFDHQQQRLPAESVVVATETTPNTWRPWTHTFPMITAFTVLDSNAVAQQRLNEDTIVARFMLYRFEKQHVDRLSKQAYVLNCSTLELIPTDLQGQADLAQRRVLQAHDRLIKEVCPR